MYRRTRPRPAVGWSDRLFWVGLRRAWTDWRSALVIVRPATVVEWHRRGFAWSWTWRSRPTGGRPRVNGALRRLIGEMAGANPLWGRHASTASSSSWGSPCPSGRCPG